MVKLRCISRYTARQLSFEPGDVIEVSEAEAAQLEADSPGSFERVEAVEVKAPAAPPEHRMIQQPHERKRNRR